MCVIVRSSGFSRFNVWSPLRRFNCSTCVVARSSAFRRLGLHRLKAELQTRTASVEIRLAFHQARRLAGDHLAQDGRPRLPGRCSRGSRSRTPGHDGGNRSDGDSTRYNRNGSDSLVPADVLSSVQWNAPSRGPVIETAVGGEVPRHGLPQIVRASRILRLTALKGAKTVVMALLTQTSIGPSFSSIRVAAFSTCWGSLTSTCSPSASAAPRCFNSSTVC